MMCIFVYMHISHNPPHESWLKSHPQDLLDGAGAAPAAPSAPAPPAPVALDIFGAPEPMGAAAMVPGLVTSGLKYGGNMPAIVI